MDMKLIRIIFPIILFSLFLNCSGTKSIESNEIEEIQLENVRRLIASRSFKFLAETAYPMQTYDAMTVTNALLQNTGSYGGRISLIGNGDYLKLENDLAVAELPFFGEIRIGTTIDPQKGGIKFNNSPIDFEIIKNEKKKNLTVKFDIRSNSEVFEINIRVYPNKNAVLYISSINRTVIRYDGKISELLKEETQPNQ